MLLVSERGTEHGRWLSQGPCQDRTSLTRAAPGLRGYWLGACYDPVADPRSLYRIEVTTSAHVVQRGAWRGRYFLRAIFVVFGTAEDIVVVADEVIDRDRGRDTPH